MRRRLVIAATAAVVFGAQFVALAQDGGAPSTGRSFLALLLTASPLLLFFAFFFWYVRKVGISSLGKYRERHHEHMDRVEKQLEDIKTLLDRDRSRD